MKSKTSSHWLKCLGARGSWTNNASMKPLTLWSVVDVSDEHLNTYKRNQNALESARVEKFLSCKQFEVNAGKFLFQQVFPCCCWADETLKTLRNFIIAFIVYSDDCWVFLCENQLSWDENFHSSCLHCFAFAWVLFLFIVFHPKRRKRQSFNNLLSCSMEKLKSRQKFRTLIKWRHQIKWIYLDCHKVLV